jgi:hypothetical protein
MKLELSWFKLSGKFYEAYEVEVPDDCFMWSDKVALYLNLTNHSHKDMLLTVDNVNLTPEQSKAGKFFKVCWTPARVQEVINQYYSNLGK